MNCRTLQGRMADGPWTIEDDPEAQAHLDDCPDCRRVLDQELRVRAALQRLVAPEVDEALMQRLRSIPFLTDAEMEAWSAELASRRPALSRRQRLRLAGEDAWDWLRGRGQRGGGWDRGQADEGFAALAAAHPVAAKQRGRPGGRIRASTAELLLLGAVAAVAVFLLWPFGRQLLQGQGTATPPAPSESATPAPDATMATPEAGLEGTAMAWPEASDPFPFPERVAELESALRDKPPPQLSEQDAAAYAAADARAAAADPVWRDASPVELAGRGMEPWDFCVQPQRGVLLFVMGDARAPGAKQPEAGLKQRVLQVRLADLALGVSVEARMYADLSGLPGTAEDTRLEDIDCAQEGGRVLVSRSGLAAMSYGERDLWLLDGQGRRLNDAPMGLGPDLGPDEAILDAELAPDGQAALILEAMGGVDVLRLDAVAADGAGLGDLPGGTPRRLGTGGSISTPAGGGGGELRWNADSRSFLLVGYEVEGPVLALYRWDGQAARLVYQGRGFHAYSAETPVPPNTPVPHWAGEPLPGLRGRLDGASLHFSAGGKLTWLQWLDAAGDGGNAPASLADGEQRLEVVVWDWAADLAEGGGAGGDSGRSGGAGFSGSTWQALLLNTHQRDINIEQAIGRGNHGRDAQQSEREWYLLDGNGYLHLVADGRARLLAKAAAQVRALDTAPMPAMGAGAAAALAGPDAELLVFKKLVPVEYDDNGGYAMSGADEGLADWLGVLVVPGGA